MNEFRNLVKKIIKEDVFLQNISKINKIITIEHPKEIKNLLLGMFPNAEEIINYQYNDEAGQPFAEWRRVIYEIDNYILSGPKTIDSNEIKLSQEGLLDKQEKYNQYIKNKDAGKSVKYFRDNNADPRTIDFTKLPPITLINKNSHFEALDGSHRIFLAQMNKKPLRAYIWRVGKNNHPNVEKIKSLFKYCLSASDKLKICKFAHG